MSEKRAIKCRLPFFKEDGSFSHFQYWGRGINNSSFASPGMCNFAEPGEDEQFTGLKDKNGTESYENDLVQRPDGQGRIGVIQFARGMFGINWDYATNKDPEWQDGMMFGVWGTLTNLRHIDDGFLSDLIIIGNIHQSPELLK